MSAGRAGANPDGMSFGAMRSHVTPRRDPATVALASVATAVIALLGAGAALGVKPGLPTAALTTVIVAAAIHRWLLSWRTLLAVIALVILFIPMRRYQLPSGLPFHLEPYRLAVALIAVAWVGSLLVQPATRLRRTGFEGPLALFALAVPLGLFFNTGRISSLGVSQDVTKAVTFFASFIVVTYLVASVTVRRPDVDGLVRVLVGGGAIVATAALVESRTGFNVFDHLQRVFPPLHFDPTQTPRWGDTRGGKVRAYASAQHSIALGAALAMLIPLAVYQARRAAKPAWWLALVLLALGVFTTVSRTAMLMLVVEAIVLARLKPANMKRFWPLAIPLLVAVHIAIPGTLGAFKGAFFPAGGIVAEQQSGAGTYGSGRLADLGPGLAEWAQTPLFGQGLGTRVTDRTDPKWNAPILDDQWLGTLLETGAVGFLALLWLFARAVRRLGREARRDPSERGWLAAGLSASICAFAFGMTTVDAFSFAQMTFLVFIMLGIGAAELNIRRTVAPIEQLERRSPAA